MDKKTTPISLGFDPAIENREGWSRREFLRAATVAGIAGFLGFGLEAAAAQQPGKVPQIGFISGGFPSGSLGNVEAFRKGLRELGYVEGKNIKVEFRYAETKVERYPEFLAELIRLKVDVIVTSSTPPTLAAKDATKTVPIVFVAVGDPVVSGLVASLARPGGNLTGLSILAPELSGKRLELLKEAVPRLSRVAILYNPANPATTPILKEIDAAAQALGLQLQSLEARNIKEFESAFQAATRGNAKALAVLVDPLFTSNRKRIVELATKNRLPAIYSWTEFVDDGGLMSYGPSFPDLFRRAATYVDKILKGRTPADLPVEQPMRFELIINLNAAKQIGLTVPPNLLVRADRVIR
jgi:putative tryptophan/tyrosine transport system substrate-binding protein